MKTKSKAMKRKLTTGATTIQATVGKLRKDYEAKLNKLQNVNPYNMPPGWKFGEELAKLLADYKADLAIVIAGFSSELAGDLTGQKQIDEQKFYIGMRIGMRVEERVGFTNSLEVIAGYLQGVNGNSMFSNHSARAGLLHHLQLAEKVHQQEAPILREMRTKLLNDEEAEKEIWKEVHEAGFKIAGTVDPYIQQEAELLAGGRNLRVDGVLQPLEAYIVGVLEHFEKQIEKVYGV